MKPCMRSRAVASGEAEFEEITDWTGGTAQQASVGRLTVEVAPPGGPPVELGCREGG